MRDGFAIDPVEGRASQLSSRHQLDLQIVGNVAQAAIARTDLNASRIRMPGEIIERACAPADMAFCLNEDGLKPSDFQLVRSEQPSQPCANHDDICLRVAPGRTGCRARDQGGARALQHFTPHQLH